MVWEWFYFLSLQTAKGHAESTSEKSLALESDRENRIISCHLVTYDVSSALITPWPLKFISFSFSPDWIEVTIFCAACCWRVLRDRLRELFRHCHRLTLWIFSLDAFPVQDDREWYFISFREASIFWFPVSLNASVKTCTRNWSPGCLGLRACVCVFIAVQITNCKEGWIYFPFGFKVSI